MDSPTIIGPETLRTCNGTARRRSSDSNSPEFEFWMVRNPSFPQPNLLSADELFVDGILLPLHLLSHKPSDPPEQKPEPDPEPPNKEPGDQEPGPGPGAELTRSTCDSANGLATSKRWKDIFKKGDKKATAKNTEDKDKNREKEKDREKEKEKEKEKKRDKKSQSGVSSAELNINIWPFSRSRSAGNNGTRHRLVPGAPGTRKVSSAPCSRSNSAGESKSRKWPSSPGRAGVHLGRSSPIWQVKRGGSGLKNSEPVSRSVEKGVSRKDISSKSKLTSNGSTNGNGGGGSGGKVRVLNLNVNVPTCIGYRHHLSCRSDENSALGVVGIGCDKTSNSGSSGGGGNGGGGGGGGTSSNLFNLRSLFTKKVY